MRNPFTDKPVTAREMQLAAIIVGIVERRNSLRAIEMFKIINPPPVWSDSEIMDTIATLVDARMIILNSGELKLVR